MSSRHSKYDALPRHTLDAYGHEVIVEPGVQNRFSLSLCSPAEAPASSSSSSLSYSSLLSSEDALSDLEVTWSAVPVEGSAFEDSATFEFVQGGSLGNSHPTRGREVLVVATPANAQFTVRATVSGSRDKQRGAVVVEAVAVLKTVRREIRKLDEEDRDAYLSALHTVYTTGTAEGQEKYGEDFTSHGDLAALHANDSFEYHGGLQFLTQHPAMQLRLERSLRSVNPNVATPYWDFLVDAALGPDWGSAVIYQDDWFGAARTTAEGGWRVPGRFHDVKRTYDPTHAQYPDSEHSLSGFISGTGSMQLTPYLTRSNSVCGFELTEGFSDCTHISKCFAKFETYNEAGGDDRKSALYEFDLCMEHYVHANLHDMHAGLWDCDESANWQTFYEKHSDWLDPTLYSQLAVNMADTIWSWKDDLDCPESCDPTVDTFETCRCTSTLEVGAGKVAAPSDVDNLMTDSEVSEKVASIWYTLCDMSYGNRYTVHFEPVDGVVEAADVCVPDNMSKEHKLLLDRHIIKTLLWPGNFGDMFSSEHGGAPGDPLFWVIHQVFDKALHALRLSPRYNKHGFAWDNSKGGTTQGRGWTNEVPFKPADFEPYLGKYMELIPNGFLTNKDLWSLMEPGSRANSYVYEELTHWGTCNFDPMAVVDGH